VLLAGRATSVPGWNGPLPGIAGGGPQSVNRRT